jgi:hypothetical protein
VKHTSFKTPFRGKEDLRTTGMVKKAPSSIKHNTNKTSEPATPIEDEYSSDEDLDMTRRVTVALTRADEIPDICRRESIQTFGSRGRKGTVKLCKAEEIPDETEIYSTEDRGFDSDTISRESLEDT